MTSSEFLASKRIDTVPSVYTYALYNDFVKDRLNVGKHHDGRGLTRKLAESLQCHPTFISQVINRKAEFSTEQALRFARFFEMNASETEYFVDLIGFARAGDDYAKTFFRTKLEKQKVSQTQFIAPRNETFASMSDDQFRYFSSWILQAVHAVLQLENRKTAEKIGAYLGFREFDVQDALLALEKIGIARKVGEEWDCTTHFIHLEEKSPLIRHFHSQWRQRVCQNFLKGDSALGLHYSGALTFSHEAEPLVREILLSSLDQIMKTIKPSPSQTAFGLNLDFFPLRM